jgi:hypothetical protein
MPGEFEWPAMNAAPSWRKTESNGLPLDMLRVLRAIRLGLSEVACYERGSELAKNRVERPAMSEVEWLQR